MGMLEVSMNMKAGYRDPADLIDVLLDYDVGGLRVHKVFKAWHLGENWYEFANDAELYDKLPVRIGWFTAAERDGVLTLQVREADYEQ